ncbi:hypothetical protein PC129_g6585 [Phytophthora cactorum]|uniref:Cytochrome b5 domain-containing protein 1 n=2 Tax=Phytophthora cactorum TaxID=29920 RepID=A0A8T1GI90_9STRA|nr:hypothetical protein PC112_g8183 [Phytophthora cactorum]KAG2832105.1 hypothetical protein PC111_g6731 [Phytophthora cactorum]KAG2860029.1 hypothetical protein PC113_g8413 [Phytophthora cactorum]KAG2991900.1 hypothetical protein PC118_g4863 [Phytophthora cactorum]KAG3027128.1 hypothetical protein PC119_g7509 [Phytophthora cactorum]
MTETKDGDSDVKQSGRMRFFTPREVASHNLATDCWVSINYRVFDLSLLVEENPGILVEPLVLHAGEDISHWFNLDTEDVKYHVEPERNLSVPFVPYGRFLHVPPPDPTAQWRTADLLPWWRDPKYVVGRLTKKARWLEIVNMLTQQRHSLEVCCEETIAEIQTRYLRLNAHAGSYTWKRLEEDEFVPMYMQRTLDENGIPDESPIFERFDMDEQQFMPTLHIYFDDDLTVIVAWILLWEEMITRAVPSIKGQSDPSSYESTGFQGRVRPPEDILRQARATSITGVLGQIACVASYALEILQELKDETTEVQDRMSKLHRRVDILAEVVDNQIHQHVSASSYSGAADRPAPVVEAYKRCESVPPLELLDRFYDSENQLDNHVIGSGPHAGSISRKKYSNPGFFMEEWLKNEKERQQRALEIKEERRRERRDAHHLRKARELDQQRQTTSSEETKNSSYTSTDDTEQKLKFLKIRSWREIYGTGEGKELMKQHSGRSPTLRDLRKKAHQGLASITQNPRAEERQQPLTTPPPPPPQDEPGHQSLTNEQFITTPPDSPSIPTSLGGAFMQEMDDDEIAMEMQLEGEFTNGIPPPPPPLPDSTGPEEFTDHGLSYYHDPATHNLIPPPPPPPEVDEQSKSDAYYDTYEEEDDGRPPPSPMEEFEQPPPPPSFEPPRAASLLEEIQLGASLRSASERKAQREASVHPPGPQAALLQQILQKQSRHLRPVEPRTRPPLQTRHSTGAPFADSIARILERRTVTAYESDSSNNNEDDDDW